MGTGKKKKKKRAIALRSDPLEKRIGLGATQQQRKLRFESAYIYVLCGNISTSPTDGNAM
jgi:hypothetical protein